MRQLQVTKDRVFGLLASKRARDGGGERSLERRGKLTRRGTVQAVKRTCTQRYTCILSLALIFWHLNFKNTVGISAVWPWWFGLHNARWVGCAVQEPRADRRRKTWCTDVLNGCRQGWTHLLRRIQSWIQGAADYCISCSSGHKIKFYNRLTVLVSWSVAVRLQ